MTGFTTGQASLSKPVSYLWNLFCLPVWKSTLCKSSGKNKEPVPLPVFKRQVTKARLNFSKNSSKNNLARKRATLNFAFFKIKSNIESIRIKIWTEQIRSVNTVFSYLLTQDDYTANISVPFSFRYGKTNDGWLEFWILASIVKESPEHIMFVSILKLIIDWPITELLKHKKSKFIITFIYFLIIWIGESLPSMKSR